MPPYVEVDHHDDGHELIISSAKEPLITDGNISSNGNNDEPILSPLFRDNSIPSTTFGLDRRLCDPDFNTTAISAVGGSNNNDAVRQAVAPVVSVITSIIGPESAYVRNNTETTTTSSSTSSSGNSQGASSQPAKAAGATSALKNNNKITNKRCQSQPQRHQKLIMIMPKIIPRQRMPINQCTFVHQDMFPKRDGNWSNRCPIG